MASTSRSGASFSSMKRLGGRPVIDYLIQYSADAKNPPDRRKVALAALEGRVDKNNTADVERIFAIAKDDSTPDEVRDIAFLRLGELPKDQVVPKLYTLFQDKKWKVRWVAATNVLHAITTKQLPEFFNKLPTSRLALNEPLSYGAAIAKMEPPAGDPKPRDVLISHLNSPQIGAKLTALGSFYQGKKADISVVDSKTSDPTPIPKCDPSEDCGWTCDVPKAGATDKNDKESKTILTVGDFARYCIEPSMVTP